MKPLYRHTIFMSIASGASCHSVNRREHAGDVADELGQVSAHAEKRAVVNHPRTTSQYVVIPESNLPLRGVGGVR